MPPSGAGSRVFGPSRSLEGSQAWAINSIGRVPCSQRGGYWFESSIAHQPTRAPELESSPPSTKDRSFGERLRSVKSATSRGACAAPRRDRGYHAFVTSCQDWIGALSVLRDDRVPCVLVVVAGVKGSAPREEGARMIVAKDSIRHGTIGGGRLEQLATEHAQEMLTGDSVPDSRKIQRASSTEFFITCGSLLRVP